jgi:hypothetical protein
VFDPGTDFQKVPAVYGIAIVTAKGNLTHLTDLVLANAIFKKIQTQLAIQQRVRNFSTWASWALQCANATEFNVPMIPGYHARSTSVL